MFITAVLFEFNKEALFFIDSNVGELDLFVGSCDEDVWDIFPGSLFGDGLWVPPVHNVQNTVSHVSQNKSSFKKGNTY